MTRFGDIQARHAAATPGPWRAGPFDTGKPRGTCAWVFPPAGHTLDRVADCGADTEEGRADAEFIAHCPDDVRWLLDRVTRLTEALADIAEEVNAGTFTDLWVIERARAALDTEQT